MVDFELGLSNAIEKACPSTDLSYCFFHLCQSMWRNVQNKGLATEYSENQEFRMLVKSICALAFVPVKDVVHLFEQLTLNVDESHQKITDYFEDHYIGRLRSGNRRAKPTFPIKKWNMYDRTLSELPRTNNSLEGFHNGFRVMMGQANPTVWKFLSKLQVVEQAERLKLHEIQVGKYKKKQSSLYIWTNKNVIHLCDNYGKCADDKIGYLKKIAGFMDLSD